LKPDADRHPAAATKRRYPCGLRPALHKKKRARHALHRGPKPRQGTTSIFLVAKLPRVLFGLRKCFVCVELVFGLLVTRRGKRTGRSRPVLPPSGPMRRSETTGHQPRKDTEALLAKTLLVNSLSEIRSCPDISQRAKSADGLECAIFNRLQRRQNPCVRFLAVESSSVFRRRGGRQPCWPAPPLLRRHPFGLFPESRRSASKWTQRLLAAPAHAAQGRPTRLHKTRDPSPVTGF